MEIIWNTSLQSFNTWVESNGIKKDCFEKNRVLIWKYENQIFLMTKDHSSVSSIRVLLLKLFIIFLLRRFLQKGVSRVSSVIWLYWRRNANIPNNFGMLLHCDTGQKSPFHYLPWFQLNSKENLLQCLFLLVLS